MVVAANLVGNLCLVEWIASGLAWRKVGEVGRMKNCIVVVENGDEASVLGSSSQVVEGGLFERWNFAGGRRMQVWCWVCLLRRLGSDDDADAEVSAGHAVVSL